LHEQGDIDALPAVILHAHAVRDGTDALLTQIELVPALRGAVIGILISSGSSL
jgi:hypothetical protein